MRRVFAVIAALVLFALAAAPALAVNPPVGGTGVVDAGYAISVGRICNSAPPTATSTTCWDQFKEVYDVFVGGVMVGQLNGPLFSGVGYTVSLNPNQNPN